jgi:hypothetical protein
MAYEKKTAYGVYCDSMGEPVLESTPTRVAGVIDVVLVERLASFGFRKRVDAREVSFTPVGALRAFIEKKKEEMREHEKGVSSAVRACEWAEKELNKLGEKFVLDMVGEK